MYKTAIEILKKLEELGMESYIVGGYPRNKMMNLSCTDIDICTCAIPEQISMHFHILKDNHQYGSMTILENDYIYEITTFRKDYYMNNRYPKIEYVTSILEDLKRRDFIINTLLINKDGKYIDLLGAKKDIQNKIIRSVGNPDQKLKEDPVRIIRVIRFHIDLGFKIEEELEKSIEKNLPLLRTLTNKCLEKEMNKIINKDHKFLSKLKMR